MKNAKDTPQRWADGTTRSQGNAFDWKNYETMCTWVFRKVAEANLAPMPTAFSLSLISNPNADRAKTERIRRGGI